MKPRCKHRFVFFVCLLLLGEEYSLVKAKNSKEPRHNHIHQNSKKFKYQANEDGSTNPGSKSGSGSTKVGLNTMQKATTSGSPMAGSNSQSVSSHLTPQRPIEEYSSSKRGWVNFIFKAARIPARLVKFVELAAAGTAMTIAVYQAIRGCKDTPGAEEYLDKFLKKKEETNNLNKKAESLQLEAEVYQLYVQDTAEMYGNIIRKLDEIDTDSDNMLKQISPAVEIESRNAAEEIEKLAKEANRTATEMEYMQVDSIYKTKLENAIGILIPAITLAVPAGKAMFKFAKERFKERKIAIMESKVGKIFKLPAKISANFRKTKLAQGIGRLQTRVGSRFSKLKSTFNTRFARLKNVAVKFKKAIGAGFSLALAGYQIYASIQSLKQCTTIRDNIVDAYYKMSNASKDIQGQIESIETHSQEMNKNWNYLLGNLTDEAFIESITTAKKVMENAGSTSEPMQAVATGLGQYLSGIQSTQSPNATYNLTKDMYGNLIKVPFAFVCYKNKIMILNTVAEDCKNGATAAIGKLLQKERQRYEDIVNDPGSPRRCKDERGIDYITEENIQKSWENLADTKGYHHVCFMNSKLVRDLLCDAYVEKRQSPEEIAETFDFDVEDMTEVTKVLRLLLPVRLRSLVCRIRKRENPSYAAIMKTKSWITMEHIEAVKCPVADDEQCIPADIVPEIERREE